MTMSPEEKEEFLQIYLDETEEELDSLVEKMLVLEENPNSRDDLNEAFRMVHSMKGAAGMLGFSEVTAVTHLLESRFEKLRSGILTLDQPTMAVTLECVDYLRECNVHLRQNENFPSPEQLLQKLETLDRQSYEATVAQRAGSTIDTGESPISKGTKSSETGSAKSVAIPNAVLIDAAVFHIQVSFEPGLRLLDMKAQLIQTRLSDLGEVKVIRPTLEELAAKTGPVAFELLVASDRDPEMLQDAADVHGVSGLTVDKITGSKLPSVAQEIQQSTGEVESPPMKSGEPKPESQVEPKKKVAETVRVEIDRLDNLLNLAGELVVNKARFSQIAGQMKPAFKRGNDLGRLRAFVDSIRLLIQNTKESDIAASGQFSGLEDDLRLLENQVEHWEQTRKSFGQINEAIDQLSRVSDSLQRGVLQTRMIPVAPLFNRFKRVVRDLSKEKNKKTSLQIKGEKTELDKRMIDELGDPLVHLVRNSIDHGMESTEERLRLRKPEVGTILLEASHRGNHIFISVSDDGGGIDPSKISRRAVERGLLSSAMANAMTDQQLIEYIWHPGFSTAETVTNISGRGVGMDIVKTRISDLNGTIEVRSEIGVGTKFSIRLPLTLAIINSLLLRIRDVVYGVPIDDVREIVSLTPDQVLSVHGKFTFNVRGQYLPLISIDDLFQWAGKSHTRQMPNTMNKVTNVLVLQSAGKAVGLCVDELLGSEDIVIKSLSENFVNIRGLSGASILGDGTVSLLLDVGTVLELAMDGPQGTYEANGTQLTGIQSDGSDTFA